uniref:Uncharacterized protein n=1 Tax=Fagus sylvatica TaxID=28930 RepID=A0A2N9H7Q3_FAGSY
MAAGGTSRSSRKAYARQIHNVLVTQKMDKKAKTGRPSHYFHRGRRPKGRRGGSFAPERNAAVMEEVDKLLMAGFIREVYYPEWLANVLSPSKNRSTSGLLLPDISYLAFMDAFSGYNQIQMAEEDQEKTAFITSRGLFCYKAMPFGLKNAGATYQRLVNKMFHDQIGRNVEVYVDDMLVKSKKDDDHLADLKETFQTLRKYNMKLNPAKCVFGVSSGTAFQWTEECQQAFEELKAYLTSPPLLSPSQTGEELYLYLAVSASAVSSALIREEERIQKPVYYTSRALRDYRPRTAIKAQALADFIAEFTHPLKEDKESGEGEAWTVNIDGSSTKEMSGAGVILVSPKKDKFEYALQLRFRATNNEAEYEALLAGLKLSKKEDNVAADRLARLASSGIEIDGFIEIQGRPSTEEEIVNSITINTTWMSPITHYLREGTLPADRTEAHKLRIRASHFREVHEGICGNHSGARSLAHKLTRAGYYWPSLLHDATQYVKTCDKCQRFANIPRVPPEEITPITSPWPFAQWGLDIMGPFPVGTKQAKFLVVAIDYFTKWVEAEPLATISEKNVKSFVWKAMSSAPTSKWSSRSHKPEPYSSRLRPGLKGGKEYLTFGTEAVIPVEIGLTTLRTTFHKEEENEGQLRLNLDLLDETREKAAQRIALYQGKMARYYNTKVKLRRFEIGDWVLRKVTQATKDPSQGKLGPN